MLVYLSPFEIHREIIRLTSVVWLDFGEELHLVNYNSCTLVFTALGVNWSR